MAYRLILAFLLLELTISSEWNYQGQSMDYWIEKYPSCAGVLQSPINLQEAKAIYNSKLNPIKFHNYDWLVTWNVSYNGYTITANQLFNKTLTPYITGSDFKSENKYYLKEFHFHWGFNIYQGSEHHLDSNKFPLEIHLVHVSDLNEIAVIGFLFQIDNKDNDNIETLVTQVGKDQTMSNFSLINFSLNSFIPDENLREKHGYFRYLGSLTTPPCTEGIIWTIYRAKINISEAQMEQFYKNEIDFNNREIQELNDRKLFTSIQTKVSVTENNESQNYFLIVIRFLYNLLIQLLALII